MDGQHRAGECGSLGLCYQAADWGPTYNSGIWVSPMPLLWLHFTLLCKRAVRGLEWQVSFSEAQAPDFSARQRAHLPSDGSWEPRTGTTPLLISPGPPPAIGSEKLPFPYMPLPAPSPLGPLQQPPCPPPHTQTLATYTPAPLPGDQGDF